MLTFDVPLILDTALIACILALDAVTLCNTKVKDLISMAMIIDTPLKNSTGKLQQANKSATNGAHTNK
jgi:hypothetical protein